MGITRVYFSPSGKTEKVSRILASHLGGNVLSFDLLRKPLKEIKTFGSDDVVVVAMPVFMGRIPKNCATMLKNLKGQGTPAIGVVVYGNRVYEDSLLELTDILQANEFNVIGAGAFIAQHSIFPAVGALRPDANDEGRIMSFALECKKKLEAGSNAYTMAKKVSGNRPYYEPAMGGFVPDTTDACTDCGICSPLCPAGAIPEDDPTKTDPMKCISCTACIYACPSHARLFRGELFKKSSEVFVARYGGKRQEPEIFL